jgi:drug/metabolite transporter (DMT)-like permease
VGELAALAASGLWAFASILWTRLGAHTAPLPLNFVKTGLAAIMLAVGIPLAGASFDASSTDLLLLAASGVLGLTLGDTAYFHALQNIGPRRTLLIWTLTPFVTALMAWAALDEPLTAHLSGAILLTIGGVALVVTDRASSKHVSGRVAVGVTFALLSVGAQAGSNVVVKFAGADVGAFSASVVRLAAGTAGLGVQLGLLRRLGEAMGPLKEGRSVATVVVATFFGTVLGIWFSVYGVLHSSQVAVAATLNSLSPIFVLPLSWWLLGERFGARAVAGAFVAVAGVAALAL